MEINPKQARIQNRQLVFRNIYSGGGMRRAQIACLTKLTRPIVSDVVADLIEEGLIEESGLKESSGGRRGMILILVDGARSLLGLDFARGDFNGAVIHLR